MQHHAEALRADANEGDIDFVAGRNIARAAQNVAWNDGKADGGSGGLLQKFAARE